MGHAGVELSDVVTARYGDGELHGLSPGGGRSVSERGGAAVVEL